jgi:hypothetical protein
MVALSSIVLARTHVYVTIRPMTGEDAEPKRLYRPTMPYERNQQAQEEQQLSSASRRARESTHASMDEEGAKVESEAVLTAMRIWMRLC